VVAKSRLRRSIAAVAAGDNAPLMARVFETQNDYSRAKAQAWNNPKEQADHLGGVPNQTP
jgi:hypothetical protein